MPSHDPNTVVVNLRLKNLTQTELLKELQTLEVSLRTEPIGWVKEFVSAGGTEVLISNLREAIIKEK